MICPADSHAPRLAERDIEGSACQPARRLSEADFRHFVMAVAISAHERSLALLVPLAG